MTAERYLTLKAKLDAFETWPHEYTFKFIVPAERREDLEALFTGHEYTLRPSRTGKYFSLTCLREMPDSDAVIQIYERVSEIEGSFAL
ncbi:DUF493 domain-containing protein [bacterium]|nr:MAG: DUF493 domain-containing protein [bacterium]